MRSVKTTTLASELRHEMDDDWLAANPPLTLRNYLTENGLAILAGSKRQCW